MKSGYDKKESRQRKKLPRRDYYYQSGQLFYHRLWRQRLLQLGFRVISVEKLDAHHLWDLRLDGSLSAQSQLLLSRPVSRKPETAAHLLEKQLQAQIQQIGAEFGAPIPNDCIVVVRHGTYFRVAFGWPKGRPGILLQTQKKTNASSTSIRRWLRRTRN
jgi:hypothetical protein